MKRIDNRKELRAVLKRSKFYTFDQDGTCFHQWYGKPLCKVIQLEGKLPERISDKLDIYFEGPGFLYIFDSITDAKQFIEVNLTKYEQEISNPNSKEMIYTILLAMATTDTILQFDSKLLRLWLNYRDRGAIRELSSWRCINNCLKNMLLVVNSFINH